MEKNKQKKAMRRQRGWFQAKWYSWLIIGLIICLSSLLLIWLLAPDLPLESPLSSISSFRFIMSMEKRIEPPDNPKLVMGFLPYWNINRTTIQPEVSQLIYFSLAIDGKGNIVTHQDGAEEPGYNKLNSEELFALAEQVSPNSKKFSLSLTQFNNDDIANFLSKTDSWQNFFASLDSLLLAYPIDGINIDIEYTGEVTDALRANFVVFMKNLRHHLNSKYQNIQLSIDMYSSAASRYLIWDVANIEPHIDYVIVMAYDYHRRTSTQAGPVAPLFDQNDEEDDINHHLKKFTDVVPRSKIIFGIPFYGYEWQTTSTEIHAHTYPGTGATATYKRVKKLMTRRKELNLIEYWDNYALSPYLSYQEKNEAGELETYVIFYENPKSLAYKLDYVNQLDLAGIAIWALGYEGEERELWEVIGGKI